MVLQIFGYKESLRVKLALVVAEHEGIKYEFVHVDPKKGQGLDSEPYASTFPVKKVRLPQYSAIEPQTLNSCFPGLGANPD